MLRATVSVKDIGDLGHCAADSTLVYLKLATEDLCAVALEIPTWVDGMKTTSICKGSTPENYVRELRLRSPVSSQVYLSILNGFQSFVVEQEEDRSVPQTTQPRTRKQSIRRFLQGRPDPYGDPLTELI